MRRLLACAILLAACDAPLVEPDGGGDAAREAGADAGAPARLWLRDDEGGVLLLRGTNVSGDSKDPPDFVPNDFATAADFARLRDELGMNAVRYLIFWEAIEPERGVYDDAYLAEARRRVEEARAAGLHVIVDMHQDVYGRGFGFDGAPAWTCDQALYDSFDEDRPSEWYLGYTRAEVQTCFDRLYTDAEIRAAFAEAWRRAAEALSGVVLAYEVLNEPHWGTTPVRSFEQTVLPAFYEECIEAIRSEDADAFVLLEPSSTANLGLRSNLAPPDRARLVYAPHVYPAELEQGAGWTGTRAELDAWLAGLEGDAARMGLPLVITELGARPSIAGATRYLREVYDAIDAASLSAMQWDAGRGGYGLFDAELAPSEVALSVARPHPARTAGVPGTISWDAEARVFTYAWDEDGSALGDTVITAPSLVFPDGVQVEPPSAARVEGSLVIVPQAGGERSITLRPL